MKRTFLLLILFPFFLNFTYAQEICNDGIDNDGDGFIDCFDGDCVSDAACDGFYMGNDASCEAEPNAFPQFSLSLGYQSSNDVTLSLSRIAIGDLDRDGIPEILSSNIYDDKIFLLNGGDATVKFEVNTNNPSFKSASMANLQDDNCGEVFIINENSSNNYVISSYDCQLNLLWGSEVLVQDPVNLSYADFDRDGKAEMYYKDEIRDPVTGTRIVQSSATNWDDLPSGGVAVDILGDEDLELVLGNRIYAVELNDRSQDAGNLTLLATMPVSFQIKQGSYRSGLSSSTSVVDYNLDGNLDVIVTGATGGTPTTNVTSVFLWDVANSTVKTFSDPRPLDPGYEFGWRRGMGRVNVGDVTGDGRLNALFVSGNFFYALDENWEMLWVDNLGNYNPTVINEESSGLTSSTLFDFNGDGKSEIIYRDEDYLYIINGNDGSINTQIHCRSRTQIESLIIADVDADGSTEICVTCYSEDFNPTARGRELNLNDPAEVRIYKSAGEPWVPSRKVWNQHAYFNVNVNDDLTIPRNQQKHQMVFSTGVCSTGPSRPLNSFLNQSPFLSSDGCPTYPSPDLSIISSTFAISEPTCPDEDFTVSFDFENIGDVSLSGDVPITFYDGDPLVAGTNKLNTSTISISNFQPGQVASSPDLTVNGTGAKITLYAVLNDNGSNIPTPISLPSTNFLECDFFNNIISAEIDPVPFSISTEVIDNIGCSIGGTPSGSARVFKLEGTTEVTANYDFFWFNGTTVDSTPDFTGSTYTGLSAGTYTVFATDKIAGCSSDTIQVVVEDTERTLEADITIDRGNENCQNPNGELTVAINGGEPVGDFEYEWYEGNTVGGGLQIGNSHEINGLNSATYTVLVTEKATGCQTIVSAEVPDETIIPTVTATANDIACTDTETGIVSASVGGETTGYTFEWYKGSSEKPTPDYTGATVNNLPVGSYTVKVTDNSSDCESELVTVEVNQTQSPEIETIYSTENNSCDTSNPNGSVTVSILGNVADHTIEWFAGAGTTGTIVGTDTNVSGLGGGEYTARVTNNDTGCSATERVTINNNIIIPNLSVTTDPVTTCNPFNGRIEATVDLDTEADYTFYWYEGSAVKNETDFDETGSVLDSLAPGFYTVQAMNNNRSCLTNIETIEIVDEASFTASLVNTEDKDFGPIANGSITIELSRPNRDYEILLNGAFYRIVNASTQELVIDSLSEGNYDIELIDTNSACSANLSTEIFTKPNTATDILSFELESSTSAAIIDTVNHTVEIELEGLTDVTTLIPEIEISEGASIAPATNISRDFTDAVQYTITAQDETITQDWEVMVTKAEIIKEDQTITFNLPDTLSQDQSPYPLVASSSSGLPVRFSVESGSASIFNNTLVLSSESIVEVKAYQLGNDTLKSAEVIKTVVVIGTFDLSVDVKRPNGDSLEEGLAKLFNADGGLYQRQKFADGNLEFNDVLAGNYILQIIPTGELTSDIFPTYYSTAQLSKNASLVRVNNDLSLTVKMRAKGGGSNGNGQINGQVVKAEGSSNSRISIDETVTGEGISELVTYLLNKSTDEIVSMSVTDEAGSFSLQSVPKGSYDFLIDVPGMDQASTSFELPFDEQMIELNVTVYLNDDGIVDYNIDIVLANNSNAFDLNLYPNPTNGILFLRGYSGQEQNAAILSSNGAVVKTFRIIPELNQELDVSDLEDGIYYLTLENEEGVMVKIIKH